VTTTMLGSGTNTKSSTVAAGLAIGCVTGALIAHVQHKRKLNQRTREVESNDNVDDDMTFNPKFQIPKELLVEECPYREELKLAIKLALQAGKNIYPHVDNKGTTSESTTASLGISSKSNDADFATTIDIANEKLVMEGIATHFPSHKVIGEEETGTGQPPVLTADPTWIVDPIDGTANFANGLPLTCVSLGFCVGKKPVLGVVYAPLTCELFLAVKGFGSYRNTCKILSTSSNEEEALKTLSNAIVCFEFGSSRGEQNVKKLVSGMERILQHGCRCTRSLGSGVLDMCYVATGKLDVVYCGMANEGWKPWDYCAGSLVVEEAGGFVRSLQGGYVEEDGFDIYESSMICGVSKALVEESRGVILGLSK